MEVGFCAVDDGGVPPVKVQAQDAGKFKLSSVNCTGMPRHGFTGDAENNTTGMLQPQAVRLAAVASDALGPPVAKVAFMRLD